MEFDNKRIENLRIRLKENFKKLHHGDNRQLAKVRSKKVSENNPFLKSLSLDIKEWFGEEIKGFSPYTLKRVFYDNDSFNYEEDTIVFLEVFCDQIENTTFDNTDLKKADSVSLFTKLSRKIKTHQLLIGYFFGFLFSFSGLIVLPIASIGIYKTMREVENPKIKRKRYIIYSAMLLIFVCFQIFFVPKILNQDSLIGNIYRGKFNPDPAGKGLGFLSLNDANCKSGCSNVLDLVYVPKLKKEEKYYFKIYLDYHNMGSVSINNAGAKIIFKKFEKDNYLTITGKLMGDYINPIYDTSRLVNLPKNYKIKFEEGFIRNSHGENDPVNCSGYSYEINITDEILRTGVKIDVLDTQFGGWCDQGTVIATFSIVTSS
jgi:hypothetical protein